MELQQSWQEEEQDLASSANQLGRWAPTCIILDKTIPTSGKLMHWLDGSYQSLMQIYAHLRAVGQSWHHPALL